MVRFALRVTTAFALGLAMMAAVRPGLSTARSQESERPFGLFDRIFSGSERFNGGNERSEPSAGLDRTAQMSGPDAVGRLERLENQIRQLTGAIEQLQYRNQQLEGQVRRMEEAGPVRPGAQPRPAPLSGQGVPSVVPGGLRRGDAFDPAQQPNAPGAPHSLGSI